MNKNQKSQVILVNRSMSDNSIQIVIPPFRAISMYEIEDDYENIVSEIKGNILEKELQDHVLGFVEAFRDSLDTQDVFPIAEYFLSNGSPNADPSEMIQMFQLLKEFIEQASDFQRMMH